MAQKQGKNTLKQKIRRTEDRGDEGGNNIDNDRNNIDDGVGHVDKVTFGMVASVVADDETKCTQNNLKIYVESRLSSGKNLCYWSENINIPEKSLDRASRRIIQKLAKTEEQVRKKEEEDRVQSFCQVWYL
jgi:hypothetical protein